MTKADGVEAGQEVVGSDGIHIGIVGRVDGSGIVLAGRDSSEDGGRAVNARDTEGAHRLDAALIDRVDCGRVVLTIDAARAAVIDAIGG